MKKIVSLALTAILALTAAFAFSGWVEALP